MTGRTAAILRPSDLAGVRDAVRDTAGPMAIAGAGTAADWAGSLGPVDSVLDTTALTGVITHNPGDMTVSVRAGTPLRALIEEVGVHGQHVAFDAARVAAGATVGGLVATADAGPSALVYGSLRDLVIGATLVLADGTVARSGGHVIKNVAGYDLAKLVHGSYGTLAVIAEVVLRLHPVPQRTATVTVACDLAYAAELAARVLDGPSEPVALEWISDDGGLLLVRIEGTDNALDVRAGRLAHALGSRPPSSPPPSSPSASSPSTNPPPPSSPSASSPTAGNERHIRRIGSDGSAARSTGTAEAADAAAFWDAHAALVRGTPDLAVLRIGVRPSALPELLAALPAVTVAAGLGTGVATVGLAPEAVAEAHAAVHATGGTSVLRSRPAGAAAPAWGPPPSALAVLRAVKNELDPQGRLGPGRFDPWM